MLWDYRKGVRKERTERERPRARYIERLTEGKIKNIEAKEKAHYFLMVAD